MTELAGTRSARARARRPAALLLATVLTTTAGLAGCAAAPEEPAQPAGPGYHNLIFDWNGGVRGYDLFVPDSYQPDQPIPLVVLLHGRPGSPAQVRSASGMNAVAQQHGFLVAYPADIDSAAAIRDLVTRLIDGWNAAPGAVFAAGFSAGGSMSFQLATSAPEMFAAAASVGGPFLGSAAGSGEAANTGVPVSALTFAGLADRRWIGLIETGLTKWHSRFGCADGEPEWVDEEQAISRTVAACQDGSESVAYRIEDLPHFWPRTPAYRIDASETMWQFFSAHRRTG